MGQGGLTPSNISSDLRAGGDISGSISVAGDITASDDLVATDDVEVGDTLVFPAKIAGSITPTEMITDGGFADWDSDLLPDSWGVYYAGEEGSLDATKTAQSEDSHSGTYAVAAEAYVSFGGFYISNVLDASTQFAAEDTVQVSLWAKKTTGNGVVYVIYEYDSGEDGYIYNFTGVNAGTWTLDEGGPSADQLYECTPGSGSYAQTVVPLATAPAAGVDDGYITIIPAGDSGDVILIDDIDVEINSISDVENGGFESWVNVVNQVDPLTEWTFVEGSFWDVGDGEEVIQEASENGGTYAIGISVRAMKTGSDQRGYIWQAVSVGVGDDLDVSVYTKTSGGVAPYLIALNGEPGSQTQEWNFNTSSWDTQTSTLTDLPGTDNSFTMNGTTSYAETAKTIVGPDSGNVVIVLMTEDGQGGPNTYYFDMVSGIEDVVVAGSNFVGLEAYSETVSNELEATDKLLWVHTATGDEPDILQIKKNGEFSIIGDLVDFRTASTGVKVSDPSDTYNPAHKGYVDSLMTQQTVALLCVKAGIDLTSVTSQSLDCQVPSGSEFLIDNLKLKATTVTNFSSEMGASFTLKADSTSILSNVATAPTAEGNTYDYKHLLTLPTGGIPGVISAGKTFAIDVTGAWTADALVVTAYIFGTLIPAGK